MDRCSPGFLEFSVFFGVPLLVESMLPKRTIYRVSQVRTLTVETLEHVRTRFTFLGFKSRGIYFVVSFTAPRKVAVIVSEMWSIAFSTFRPLDATNPS